MLLLGDSCRLTSAGLESVTPPPPPSARHNTGLNENHTEKPLRGRHTTGCDSPHSHFYPHAHANHRGAGGGQSLCFMRCFLRGGAITIWNAGISLKNKRGSLDSQPQNQTLIPARVKAHVSLNSLNTLRWIIDASQDAEGTSRLFNERAASVQILLNSLHDSLRLLEYS